MNFLRQATRIPGARGLWKKYPVGSIPDRVRFGIWDRPHYAYGLNFAADLARKLGLSSISAIEFGVAGGNGLVALEEAAEKIGAFHGIAISVWGFDGGAGLPPPEDFRDLPHVWGEGDYVMDVAKLKARLHSAQLMLGPVAETVPAFLQSGEAPPLGFVSFDLDYYSSTVAAFKIFDGAHESMLPRICCYFDDLFHPEGACHNEYVGEHLAINEYNATHETRKLAELKGLRWMQPHSAEWHELTYIHHDFSHPLYCKKLRGREDLPLGSAG